LYFHTINSLYLACVLLHYLHSVCLSASQSKSKRKIAEHYKHRSLSHVYSNVICCDVVFLFRYILSCFCPCFSLSVVGLNIVTLFLHVEVPSFLFSCVSWSLKGDMPGFHKIDEQVVSSCLLQYKPICVMNFDKLHSKMLKGSLMVFLVYIFFGNRRHA